MDPDHWSNPVLRNRVDRVNRRGTAGIHVRSNTEKSWVEERVAWDFAVALEKRDGRPITDIRPNPADPPDILCRLDGRKIGIECVEFVDGRFIADVAKAQRKGRVLTAHGAPGFARTQWTEPRFRSHLDDLLRKKAAKYASHNLRVDILLVYTAETWLLPHQPRTWLPRHRFYGPPVFGEMFFLQDYVPPDGHPLHEILHAP